MEEKKSNASTRAKNKYTGLYDISSTEVREKVAQGNHLCKGGKPW